MLVSTPFFQELSICILGRCSLQEMANYLIIFPFFGWYKSALYSRNSSLWLLRSRKLTGWLKSPDICWGRRGGQGLMYRENNAIRTRGLFLTICTKQHNFNLQRILQYVNFMYCQHENCHTDYEEQCHTAEAHAEETHYGKS